MSLPVSRAPTEVAIQPAACQLGPSWPTSLWKKPNSKSWPAVPGATVTVTGCRLPSGGSLLLTAAACIVRETLDGVGLGAGVGTVVGVGGLVAVGGVVGATVGATVGAVVGAVVGATGALVAAGAEVPAGAL